MRSTMLLFISATFCTIIYGQNDNMSIEQKEFIIQYSFDNYKSIKPTPDLSDDLKINSHIPVNLNKNLNKTILTEKFENTLTIDDVRGNEVILTSELADFPNVNDIEFLIKIKSVLDSEGNELLDMTSNKMEKESKSSSNYKPYINGFPGFKTSIYIKPTEMEVEKIIGMIEVKIPISYDIMTLDKSQLDVKKDFINNSYKLIELRDNVIGIEFIGDNNKFKLLPLTKDKKEYAEVTKKVIPSSLYELFKDKTDITETELKELANDIIIQDTEKMFLFQLSGKADNLLIYCISEFDTINIPVELNK